MELGQEVHRQHGRAGGKEAPPEHAGAVEGGALLNGQQQAANWSSKCTGDACSQEWYMAGLPVSADCRAEHRCMAGPKSRVLGAGRLTASPVSKQTTKWAPKASWRASGNSDGNHLHGHHCRWHGHRLPGSQPQAAGSGRRTGDAGTSHVLVDGNCMRRVRQ